MAIFDLLGRRWAMGVLWQLSDGPLTFTEIQRRCNSISPAILSARLKDLTEALLLERTLDGYALTPLGAELAALLKPFAAWGAKWKAALR